MSKFNLLIVGTLAVGIFALPGVISTFTGSHEYVAPENVECQKCHPDVYAELLSSQSEHTHANSAWTEKQALDCRECHTVQDIGDSPGEGHAARKVDCAICHDSTVFGTTGGQYSDWAHAPTPGTATSGLMVEYGMNCTACHRPDGGSPSATNMFLDWVYENIENSNAAHYQFYMNAVNDTTYLLGGTESCVGCHTHVEFTITQPLGLPNMTYDPETGMFDRLE